MSKKNEMLLSVAIMLAFPLIGGFAVGAAMFEELGRKSLLMLSSWLAASVFLWSFPFVLRRINHNKTIRNERDDLITTRSALVANLVTWLFLAIACVVAYMTVGKNGVVPINMICIALVAGLVIFQMVVVLGNFVQDRRIAAHKR